MSRSPLLLRLALALVLLGGVPTAVGLYQLRTQKDALLEQVQRTHSVAASAAARQVDAFLQPHLTLADALASNEALLGDPGSAPSQDLVRSLLASRRELAALGLFNAGGETVLLARRPGMAEELPLLDDGSGGDAGAGAGSGVSLLAGATETWLRIAEPLPGGGRLVLVARAAGLDEAVQARELGDQAELMLASRRGGVVVGEPEAFASLPGDALEVARSGNVGSSCSVYRDRAGGDLVVAQSQVRQAPWFVISRQPATVAEAAREKLRRAAWTSGGMAAGLSLVLGVLAWTTVIRPIRRVAAAQRDLAGGGGEGGGSEIADLEATFELLHQRIRDHEDLGQVFLGRYQVTDLVGSGAMGSVFRGWDARLRRPVALKTVHLDAEAVDRRKLLGNLREEAAITARIHQPNVVTVYDIEEQGHVAFIAMEFVEGVNLQKLLDRRGPLDADEVLVVGSRIARGLATAHAHGLVHHDVKPANVLVGLAGEVKLTDFGVSQLISASTQAKDVICGTPGYLAPECFAGGEYGPEADLWALGVVLYQCLVGRQPFHGGVLRTTVRLTLFHEPDRLDDLFPGLDPSLADLVHDLLAKEPAKRAGDSEEVATRLEELAAGREDAWQPPVAELMGDASGGDGGRSSRRSSRSERQGGGATRLFSTGSL